jgi:NAD(P)-dependent dehydrogenase (short-subunit alcohol dehydrogenase family)
MEPVRPTMTSRSAAFDRISSARDSLLACCSCAARSSKLALGIAAGRTTCPRAAKLEWPGGTFVNMLTMVSLASMPSMVAYSAPQAAAHSITQVMRFQLAARGVRVHGVFPAAVDTDMIRHLG